jgi:sigma-E factor negative regulatory protein RseA
MNERISMLMDGEADESQLARNLVLLRSDTGVRRTWDTYHLIGDALRGHLAPALAARVSERLAAEPTVLAPRPRAPGARIARRALSAAAVVAAVALVAWVALPGLQPEPPQVAAPAPGVAPQAPPVAAVAPAAVGVENYLFAHQSFSPAGAMQGVAPYVRTVADERGSRDK